MNEGARQSIDEAQAARSELYATLNQLSDRLNYAKRVDEAVDRAEQRIRANRERNPVAFALVVTGAAVTVGLLVWAGASKLVSRRA